MKATDFVGDRMEISYFAMVDSAHSLGVKQKISNIVDAFSEINWKAEKVFFEMDGREVYFKFASALFHCKSDVLIVRNSLAMPMFFWIILIKRLQGRSVVVDVPTPLTTLSREILSSKLSFGFKFTRLVLLYFSFPWSLYSCSRVLQYANESSFFKFGLQKKTKLISNGINVRQIRKRQDPTLSVEEFVMIAVGTLADWHGFDRVIRGISTYRTLRPARMTVRLFVVGDGAARSSWEALANQLGVSDLVEFYGPKTGSELDALFDRAHVALASLGLYRKGLQMASDLKSREYSARGIPFIAGGDDIDFRPAPPFVHRVENTNAEVSIQGVLDWYVALEAKQISPESIRGYALKNLDFGVKVKSFVE